MTEQLTHKPHPAYVGVDLGQSRDWTAISVIQQTVQKPVPMYELTYLHRWRPRRYQEVVPVVRAVVTPLRPRVTVWDEWNHASSHQARVEVIVDRTGVGRPVGDLLSESDLAGAGLQLVTITGGDAVTRDTDGGWRVPKRDLASAIILALENGTLKIATGLPLAETLIAEVVNFRPKISAAGHDSYGAGSDWREGSHDDLLLATSMAIWYAERNGNTEVRPISSELARVLSQWADL